MTQDRKLKLNTFSLASTISWLYLSDGAINIIDGKHMISPYLLNTVSINVTDPNSRSDDWSG